MSRTLKDRFLFRNNKKKDQNAGAFELTFANGGTNGASSVETWTRTPPRPRSSFSSRLRESFRLFGKSKPSSTSRGLNGNDKKPDPPRFSYDASGEFSCPVEPPRRSLDSRILHKEPKEEHVEPPRKSFDVSMISTATHQREYRKLNVVAKLMGLTDPAEAPRNSLEELLKYESTLMEGEPVPRSHHPTPSPDRKNSFRGQLKQERQRQTDVRTPEEKSQPVAFHKVVERLERLQYKQAPEEITSQHKQMKKQDDSFQGNKKFLDELQRLKQLKAVQHKDGMQVHKQAKHVTEVSIVVLKTLPEAPEQGPGRASFQANLGRSSGSGSSTTGFVTRSSKQHNNRGATTKQVMQQARSAVHLPKPVNIPRIPVSSSGKRSITSHELHCNKVYASSLMRPTVASSSRIQTLSRPSRRNMRARDQTESRAALLSLRKNTPAPTKLDKTDDRTAGPNEPFSLDLTVVTTSKLERVQDSRACMQQTASKDCATEHPEEKIIPESPRLERAANLNLETFENLSPVSVLDLVSHEEAEERLHERRAQVRKVELDLKPSATSPELPCSDRGGTGRGKRRGGLKLKVFRTLLDEEEEETDCIQDWSKHEAECMKCKKVICQQIDAAIFDDLIYEAINQLT